MLHFKISVALVFIQSLLTIPYKLNKEYLQIIAELKSREMCINETKKGETFT